MEIEYLSSLIERYRMEQVQIYITDSSARILAATEADRIGGTGNTARYIPVSYTHLDVYKRQGLEQYGIRKHGGSPAGPGSRSNNCPQK